MDAGGLLDFDPSTAGLLSLVAAAQKQGAGAGAPMPGGGGGGGASPMQLGAGGLLDGMDPGEMRSQRLSAALLGLAKGLGAASQPSRIPVGFGPLLAAGAEGLMGGANDYDKNLRSGLVSNLAVSDALDKLQSRQKLDRLRDAAIAEQESGAPGPKTREYMLAAKPDALIKDNTPVQVPEGGSLVDRSGRVLFQARPKREQRSVRSGDQVIDQERGPDGEWREIGRGPAFAAQKPEREDRTLVEIYDANSPTGTRMVRREDAIGQPGKPQQELEVKTVPGPDGTMQTVVSQKRGTGAKPAADADALEKGARVKVEEDMVHNAGRLDRLTRIGQSFNPDFVKYPTQWAQAWNAFREKSGATLPPDQKAQLEAYTNFRANAFDDLNRTLKEMSGSAVTDSESKRLLKTIADADKDSPTEFMAKFKATQQAVRMAQARLGYIRAKGMSKENGFATVPLDDVPKLIDERGKALETELRAANPQADDTTVRRSVLERLSTEFGVPM